MFFSSSKVILVVVTLVVCVNGELLKPLREISSSDGYLGATLEVDVMKVCLPETCYWTRVYNNSIPGPTLRLRPGDVLELTVINKLDRTDNDIARRNNFGHLNNTNIHVHGLRVSPFQDTIEPIIAPGGTHTYRYTVPRWGAASAWYHPHAIGSATVQWAGGMFGAIIVDDTDQSEDDIVLQLQNVAFDNSPMNLKNLQWTDADDVKNQKLPVEYQWYFNRDLLQPEPAWKGSHLLINGQLRPIVSLSTSKWTRLRIFAASTFYTVHTRLIGECEWLLVTKDGIPVVSAPRKFGVLPLWPGARADVYIRCKGPGAWVLDFGDNQTKTLDPDVLGAYFTRESQFYTKRGTAVLANFQVQDDSGVPMKSLDSLHFFSTPMPNLLSASPDKRIALSFMSNNRINNRVFDMKSNTPYLQVQAGSIIEYNIQGLAEHPVHFHTHPLQLISINNDTSWSFPSYEQNADAGFMQIGDWHDTVQLYVRTATFRQQPVYTGPMHFHCHVVQHAEFGMMGYIDVIPPFFQGYSSLAATRKKKKHNKASSNSKKQST